MGFDVRRWAVRIAALAAAAMLAVMPVRAQDQSPITATVDRTTLAVGEVVQLTVSVSVTDFNAPQAVVPEFVGFDVVGTSSATEINFTNGHLTNRVSTTYRLMAQEAGEWSIDGITVTLGGNTYTAQPIKVTVTQGVAPQPKGTAVAPSNPTTSNELTGQDFFIEGLVDNTNPYVGQAITYTFRFYQAVNLFDQPYYDPPTFTGFWSEAQPDQAQYEITAAGRPYRVTELYTNLFPTAAGAVDIEPAHLTVQGTFFEPDTPMDTRAIEVEVRPLPEPAPAGFSGAVGQFAVDATVDATSGQVNQPITLRVTISGSGNLNNLPDPTWPEMPGWRVFDSKATTQRQPGNGPVSGSRLYERLLVPEKPGAATIPAIDYAYFDPQGGEYRTTSSQPIDLTVAPAEDIAPADTVITGPNKEEVSVLASDIRHLKPAPPSLESARTPLTGRTGYWLGWALPVVVLGLAVVWQTASRRRRLDPAWVRSSQAARKAIQSLRTAQRSDSDPYAAAGGILDAYLGDKLNKPAAGMTHTAMAEMLQDRGLPPALAQQVIELRRWAEAGRFAPGAGAETGHALLAQVEATVRTLEEAWR